MHASFTRSPYKSVFVVLGVGTTHRLYTIIDRSPLTLTGRVKSLAIKHIAGECMQFEADWILKVDIVEEGDRLELVEQDSEGQCGSECKTIERACQEVIGYLNTHTLGR
ncbi:hypothetical protein L1987_50151 [Smallanthus sonchifolius]|uniref:Uncharacterized protein n=1 Tax=Smallanthus sonchifolius TaxID=185202 RepID=A0ACB9FYB6_9ASTR|nr:hypothetical protein L1987_50151 [Smallanthus sonchifolius]